MKLTPIMWLFCLFVCLLVLNCAFLQSAEPLIVFEDAEPRPTQMVNRALR